MNHRLKIEILAQPDLSTCGPTCLHAVYRYHGDQQSLAEVIRRAPSFAEGGTLAVMLALDALDRGYDAAIHTFNLHVFDPTWFQGDQVDLIAKLETQLVRKAGDQRLAVATQAYVRFLRAGGRLEWGDLTAGLLRTHLEAGHPLLTGLSSTYLYQEARETAEDGTTDDTLGVPAGHFVILSGYDPVSQTIQIADPLGDNPLADEQHYAVSVERVICSILLGVLTYDANFLIIQPKTAD